MKGIFVKQSKSIDLNFIENTAKEIFGFDDATIQYETQKSQKEWEQTVAANDGVRPDQEELDQGFEMLMRHIRSEGIEPVTEEMYEAQQCKGRRVVRLKHVWRIGLVAVLVAGGLIGSTMMVTGNRIYVSKNIYSTKNRVIWDNNLYNTTKHGSLEQAYVTMEQKLGIKIITFGFLPQGMRFESSRVDEDLGTIQFSYNDEAVYLEQVSLRHATGSGTFVTDKGNVGIIYNKFLDSNISVIEVALEDGTHEYIAEIFKENATYTVSGKIDRDVFIKIVENLVYF